MMDFMCGKVDAPLVYDRDDGFHWGLFGTKMMNIYLIRPCTAELIEIIQSKVEFS